MAQHILIVDDDPVQRRLLEAAITRAGLPVVTAPGGQPALDLLHGPRGDQIALMLLDLVMPDMDGVAVLTKVRATHTDLPVIVLTAKGGIDSAVEAMRAGANDFLVKPASPERITVSIRNALKIGTLSGEVTRLKKKTENRLHFEDLDRPKLGHAAGHPAGPACGAIQHPHPDRGRMRRRQGIDRARHPGLVRARRPSFRDRQLRRDPGEPRRIDPVRPREGHVHRRNRQASRQVPGSRWRHAVPRRNRRAAARHASEAAARIAAGRSRCGRRQARR